MKESTQEAIERATGRWNCELRVTVLAAMGGHCDAIPAYRNVNGPERIPLTLQEVIDDVMDDPYPAGTGLSKTIDTPIKHALRNVLRHSECPQVAELRLRIAEAHARKHAMDLAELEASE